MTEQRDTKKKILTLMDTDLAKNFPSINNVFLTLLREFEIFRSDFTQKLRNVLPGIRGGGRKDQELTEIIEDYRTSVFYYHNILPFLKYRQKEIETINLFLEHVDEHESVGVNIEGDSIGNECISVCIFFSS